MPSSNGHQENPSLVQLTKESLLENTKAKMGEVKEENERLKMVLQHIKKDYQSLQLRLFDIVKQEELIKKLPTDHTIKSAPKHDDHDEAELVSLSLGRSPREPKNIINSTNNIDQDINVIRDINKDNHDDDQDLKANLTLGLGSEMQLTTEIVSDPSPENSSDQDHQLINKELAETKTPKTIRNGDDEVSEQPQPKRARVSVRARCDAPTMNDGCQWRKYGQKIAKGNPCPRAYYRCTVAPSCPVRKQVQRCAEDTSILITTYEGTHNHPLPVTATAMASTTSAAASMLLSGSSTSPDHRHPITTVGSTANKNNPSHSPLNNTNALNFNFFDTIRARHLFNSPNTTTTTTSSPLFPTITLDLTTTSPYSSSIHFNRLLSSSFNAPNITPRSSSSSSSSFSSQGLSFGSSEPNNILPSTLWGNGYLNYNGYYSLNLGKVESQDQFLYPRCAEKMVSSTTSNNNNNQACNSVLQESLTETLTKAITSDPTTFKSVIAAAISSMVGGQNKQDGGERLVQRLTLGEATSTASVSQNGNGVGLPSSYLNKLSSSNL